MSIMPKRMLVGDAVLYCGTFNFDDNEDTIMGALTAENRLGLGKDKVKFTATPNVVDYEFSGRNDKAVKEMQSVCGWDVTVEGDCLDLNETVLTNCLMKKVEGTTSTKYDVYTGIEGKIPEDVYLDVAVVGKDHITGDLIAIVVKDCVGTEFALEFANNEEDVATPITLKPHYSIEALDAVPFKIIAPKLA